MNCRLILLQFGLIVPALQSCDMLRGAAYLGLHAVSPPHHIRYPTYQGMFGGDIVPIEASNGVEMAGLKVYYQPSTVHELGENHLSYQALSNEQAGLANENLQLDDRQVIQMYFNAKIFILASESEGNRVLLFDEFETKRVIIKASATFSNLPSTSLAVRERLSEKELSRIVMLSVERVYTCLDRLN